MTVTSLTLKSRDGFEFGAVRVEPKGARKGGLILVQEIFGINSFMIDAANRFAAQGYEVLLPSMFDRQQPGFAREDHSPEAVAEGGGYARANGLDAAMSDIGACVDALERPVFITGFCYGGSIAYIAACRLRGLAASAAYYGSLLPAFKAAAPNCPSIAHFGRHDAHIPMDGVDAFIAARHDVPVHVYDAGHGFARQGSDDYNRPADALAFQRTLELFDKALIR
ncbi:dienelactone hydrolase family protein [Hyphomonas sp.]|jgi:carboxymethylenebutenolidase|uniref:dienelactone hydrolase family protein n=1 Tax=Hyphomonas sp. TaxID=87 RepID=UPI0039E50397